MITEIGHKYYDGTVVHVGYVEPLKTVHAYTEHADGAVRDSLLIVCSDDGLKADVFSSVEPEAIIRPNDERVVRDLLETAQYITKVLRGAEREFPMEDADLGAFHLVVKQHLELPEHYVSQSGRYN